MFKKLKLHNLKSDPLQACPNLRIQKLKLCGLFSDPLQACPFREFSNNLAIWPEIRTPYKPAPILKIKN
jgi:hypothetical protein